MKPRKLKWLTLACGLALGLTAVFVANSQPVISQSERPALKLPTAKNRRPLKKRITPVSWTQNTLLVMPFKSTDEDAVKAVREVSGTITRTIGRGSMTVWVVTFPDAQTFVKAERSLMKDENMRSVQRDYLAHTNAAPNDQYYPQQWALTALNVSPAWDLSYGNANTSIAVIDTGVTSSNFDLTGKLVSPYDAVNHTSTQTDVNGHGTMVSTTAAALAGNYSGTAGPARLSNIIPVRAGRPDGTFSNVAILDAFDYCNNSTSARLINLSVNGTPPYSVANASDNPVLHQYLQYFHDVKGGLTFNAAGNEALFDSNPLVPYLIVVSAIDETNELAYFSNWGNCVWFTAPGQNIYCSKNTSTVLSVAGTSFSSPLACGVAALTWGAKPTLTNIQVENILKQNTTNSSSGWNKFYGYGLPDAAACVAKALNTTSTAPPTVTPGTSPPPDPTLPIKKKKNPNKLWKRKK